MEKTIELLYNVVMSRKQNATEGSYTAYLFEQGLDKILKKVGEESSEVIIAAKMGIMAALSTNIRPYSPDCAHGGDWYQSR